jgi:hypothetical protein
MEDCFKLSTVKTKEDATSGVDVINVATCTTMVNVNDTCAIFNITM